MSPANSDMAAADGRVMKNALFALRRALGGELAKKLALLAVLSLLSTVLFSPALTFSGYAHSAGDVAGADIRSPVNATDGVVSVRKGEVIVREGQIITEGDLRKLVVVESSVRSESHAVSALGFFSLTAVFLAMSYVFAAGNIRKFSTSPKDLLLMGTVFLGVLLLMRLSVVAAPAVREAVPSMPPALYKYMIPLAVGPMLVRLLLNSETALVFSSVAAVMAGFFMGLDMEAAAYTLIGGLCAATWVRQCTHRSVVLKAGVMIGAVNAMALLSIFALKGGVTLKEPLFIIMAGMAGGVSAAVLAIGLTPLFETAFQYTTNIRLLELSRMDHPLLKELAMRAPGTYHHSVVIGSLVEAAAESINANPLLARVAAYYHDIGKLKMPLYFIENSTGENRHDKLAPSMSALILINHVKEGVDLAKKHRLGSEITDIISQHHGTSLITYFHQKARDRDAEPSRPVNEDDFRYSGPKPQTREAGLVMLADAIEAASKTLPDPTPDRIQWLSQKMVNRIFTDGQLDECELTLKDLHAITKSFNRVFAGIYHQRIIYPEEIFFREDARDDPGGKGGRGEGGEGGGGWAGKADGRGRIKRLGVKKP